MNEERAKYMGRRAEAELRAKDLRVACDGLVTSLRNNLDPTVPVERLWGDVIASQALDLSNKLIELEAVLSEIARINDILGR